MKFRKHISSVLLIAALFAVTGSEFIHHTEGINHNDNNCAVCNIVNALHSLISTPASHGIVVFEAYQLYAELSASLYVFSPSDNHSGRAPPLASHS